VTQQAMPNKSAAGVQINLKWHTKPAKQPLRMVANLREIDNKQATDDVELLQFIESFTGAS
jgi:hypothetical protein